MKEWLAQAGPYRVEKIASPHPELRVDMSKPAAGVLHTTEGGWDSAMSVFRAHFAPHFLVGRGRIAQLVPLGFAAAALENHSGGVDTNSWARAQIEVVGFSKTTPFSFDPETSDALAALMAALKVEAGIPLARPFADVMPPQPWATESFSRRHAGKWGAVPGWFGHVEIPENSHWDPGDLRWQPLLDHAAALLVPDVDVRTKRLAALRSWFGARRADGWSWVRIKLTNNWAEYKRLGGK